MSYRLYLGPVGKCPDCEEPTEIQLSSVLGDPRRQSWEVPRDLIRLIYQGVVRNYAYARVRVKSDADRKKTPARAKTKSLNCARCEHKPRMLHWAEILDGGVVGPFCKNCLRLALDSLSDERGLKDDVPIYVMPSRKSSLTIARSALLLRPPSPDADPLPSDDEVVLF